MPTDADLQRDNKAIPPIGVRIGDYVPPNRRPVVGQTAYNEFEVVFNGVIYRAEEIEGTVVAETVTTFTISARDHQFILNRSDIRKKA